MERYGGGYGKRLLVIDDEEDIRDFTYLALSDIGYNVFWATNGLDGLQEMKKRRYDTVIAEYNALRMEGRQFVESARVIRPNTPIIMMSGDDTVIEKLCRMNGIDGYIPKPFEFSKVLTMISRASPHQPRLRLPQESSS